MPRLPSDTVLLIVGFQQAGLPAGARTQAETSILDLIAAWRDADMPIIHVRRESPDPASPYCPGGPGWAFKMAPLGDEGVVAMVGGGGGFDDTGLEILLEERGATTLVVCGSTPDVTATTRQACALGYRVFFAPDACWLHARDLVAGPTLPDVGIAEAYETNTEELLRAAALAAAIKTMRDGKAP